jgi:hypothetical protein
LLHAIHANAGKADSRLTIIDEYFAGDDAFEPELQHRQVLLWLLSLLSPRIARRTIESAPKPLYRSRDQ